jgi:hypothetical protein
LIKVFEQFMHGHISSDSTLTSNYLIVSYIQEMSPLSRHSARLCKGYKVTGRGVYNQIGKTWFRQALIKY